MTKRPTRQPTARDRNQWANHYAILAQVELPAQEQERVRSKPKNGPTESREQRAVITWWSIVCHGYGLPYWALFAIPNGGARDQITGAILKAEGVRPGVPDLCLPVPRHDFSGLWIEMKVGDNKPSVAQIGFLNLLDFNNFKTAVCYSADEARAVIIEYLGSSPQAAAILEDRK